jgi:hypothetical protein
VIAVIAVSLRRAPLVLCLGAVTAPAQSAVRARVDNDAFNVWLGPWDRPDEEYSNGVRLSVDWAGPAFWWKRFDHDALGCATGRDRCVSHTLMLGQDIYTAARQIGEPLSPVCSRPVAQPSAS